MNFGDILVAKGLVSAENIAKALEHQKANGGRLGDSVVALGFLTADQVNEVIGEAPRSPLTIEDTGLDPMFLLQLLLKGMRIKYSVEGKVETWQLIGLTDVKRTKITHTIGAG